LQPAADHDKPPPADARLRPLLPPGGPAGAQDIVAQLGLRERALAPERPCVMLNMVSTLDGRATLAGRSGALGNRADRQLFHALRASVDAVLVGAGTVRAERYGRIIADEARRRARRDSGLSEEPLACIVSETLTLPTDIPLLSDPAAHVVVLTPSQDNLPACGAHVEYVRTRRDGHLDLHAALRELREQFGVGTLLCEGGPHLNGRLLEAGLVDELFLTVAPKLAGGDPIDAPALRIVAGPELEPPVALRLLSVADNGSHLFLRYGV
jgi:riboflavin-specific deaminase-like protein